MQSLNTSVPFKCKVRLNLWDVEERKASNPSARHRRAPVMQQRRIEKAMAISVMQMSKTGLVEKVS
jgi:hypothetical protein